MVEMGDLVDALVERICAEVRAYDVVQCDETPFQVLNEYDPSRSAKVPKRLLLSDQGFLETDGYEGYTALGQESGISHVGVLGARTETIRRSPPWPGRARKKRTKRTAKEGRARRALSQIQALCCIERELENVTAEENLVARQGRTKPLVDKLRVWSTTPSNAWRREPHGPGDALPRETMAEADPSTG